MRPRQLSAAIVVVDTDRQAGGTAFRDGSLYYYVYHYYDGDANGASFLMMRPIAWTADDWPMFSAPLWQ